MELTLISHNLCPYVQRAIIVLAEKDASFERRYVDLAHKPEWFRALSPLGKTPVLLAGGEPVFESAVICEYLEDTLVPRLHPAEVAHELGFSHRPGPAIWVARSGPDTLVRRVW